MARRTIQASRWQQWSEQEAREMLARYTQSGLTIAAFALSMGCSVSRIQYWRHKLRTSQPAAPQPFVAVHLRPSHTIKLMVDAIAVELPEDTPPERIADIIAAITQRQRAC
jgi:transposase-like protein